MYRNLEYVNSIDTNNIKNLQIVYLGIVDLLSSKVIKLLYTW